MRCTAERKKGHPKAPGAGKSESQRQGTGQKKEPESGASSEGSRGRTNRPALGALVLIVEDFDDAREILSSMLQFYGFRVAEAVQGNEAVEKALRLLPDIVLMDLALPGMDGYQATRCLKSNPRTRKIPIIAVTAHALPEDEKKARDAGCDSFLTKPVHPTELLGEMRRFLDDCTFPPRPPRGGGGGIPT